jgi:phage/plasmid-like protein (TIGR03299 family)
MAHEIDTTTGQAAIAYVGQTPWHGLGQKIDPTTNVDVWRKAAGLGWDAMRSPVMFENDTRQELQTFHDRHVLYRSDTGMPLSVVSSDYQTVQPGDILGFFKVLADAGQFQIETVGALREGRRIWALARVGEDAIIMDDKVAPYLMLATSYDGSMATMARFTTVRVVCNNTLQAALRNANGRNTVSIPHSAKFDHAQVRADLGIALDSWEAFQMQAGLMAKRKITDAEMDAYLQELLEPFIPYGTTYNPDKVRASKGYQRIVGLFQGGQYGAGQDAVKGTIWGLLNATTQYIDHEKGRLQDNRLEAAWFGPGAKIKDRAYEIAQKVAA